MGAPADFQISYHWAAPTVRPPFHYEYTVAIGPGLQGRIDYQPDYSNHHPPHWTEPFSIEAAALDALAALVESRHVFDGGLKLRSPQFVGGEQAWMEITAGGRQAEVPAGLNPAGSAKIQPVYEAVRALVPKSIWDKLEAQRQEYISSQGESG